MIDTPPPSPDRQASALIEVAASTVMVAGPAAPTAGEARIATRPPAAAPLAVTRAPLSTTSRPRMATVPPAAVCDVAATLPEMRVLPSPPSRTMTPPSRCAALAETDPGRLTTSWIARWAAAALISTRPPGAITLPLMSISAPLRPFGSVGVTTCRKPLPFRSSVACSPAPIPTLPTGATMTPDCETCPPSRPTKPPGAVRIVPPLETLADAPLPEKLSRPALKSWFVIPSVEATKPPPTLTEPDGVMAIPLGLTTNTWPLAFRSPAMTEGLPPSTRFKIAALAPGCWMVTVLDPPIEKSFQLTMAR